MFTYEQLVKAYVAIEADSNVKEVRISPGGDDVWFWTKDDVGETDDGRMPKGYDWDSHGLSDETMTKLADLGLEPMFNDCPGFLNEACLAPLRT